MKFSDIHIHAENTPADPKHLIENMKKAGMSYGCVFSNWPYEADNRIGTSFDERLSEVLSWTKGYEDTLFPVMWIHPYEENIEITSKVVEYAHSKGVSVEAELGTVGGQEDDVVADGVIYADVEECKDLVKRTNIDCLAPALGSVHGPYKGEPNLGFKEMEEIGKATGVPLVLHGGTGIPLHDIQKAVSLGTAKINVNTENQISSAKTVREVLAADKDVYDPRKYLGPAREAIKATVIGKIREFGSNNKA